MTQPPYRIIRAMVREALVISSPNLAQRLHHNNPGMAQFPPMDERRVRHGFESYIHMSSEQLNTLP